MTDSIYISRSYVEFGPFTPVEIADFQKRGLIREGDFLRAENAEVWIPASAWTLSAPEAPKAKKPATRKRTTVKKAA